MDDLVKKPVLPELRKTTVQGYVCVRRIRTVEQIKRAQNSGYEDLVRRAAINDRNSPDYVVSEVLIFVMRETKQNNNNRLFDELYGLLWQRVQNSFPWQGGSTTGTSDVQRMEMEDRVLDNFNRVISSDRSGYDEELDYYEVSFDQAIKYDRMDAWRSVMGKSKRFVSMYATDDPDKFSTEVSAALTKLGMGAKPNNEEKIYRKLILSAIKLLPDKEREVMILTLRGIPDDPTDPNAASITSILNCSAKTVYNRRQAAVTKLLVMVEGGLKDDR